MCRFFQRTHESKCVVLIFVVRITKSTIVGHVEVFFCLMNGFMIRLTMMNVLIDLIFFCIQYLQKKRT